MRKFKHFFLVVFSFAFMGLAKSQVPSYGVTTFDDPLYDGFPFIAGAAYPSILQANNVANTGWNFYVGALGLYSVTQVSNSTSPYNGAISASNVTPSGNPAVYQSFGFSTIPNTTTGAYPKFKLNSFKVKVTNSHPTTPQLLSVSGIVGTSAGGVQPLLVNPGTSWYTVTTSANPVFNDINAMLIINGNGTDPLTASVYITELVIDDIDISAPVTAGAAPTITSQPTNKTVCAGGSTTYSVVASNATSYTWYMSSDGVLYQPIISSNAGTTFTGYNTATLTVNNAQLSNNNMYFFASASNSNGNQASNVVRLFVVNQVDAGTISGPSSLCVGSTGTFSSTESGGAWSTSNRATINASTGLATATAAGTTTIRYTKTIGTCVGVATRTLTVNALPSIPTISYVPGPVNPQTGAGGGGAYCANRTFTVTGTPTGGAWSASGKISVTNGGVVTTASTAGSGSLTYTFTNGTTGCSSSRTLTGTVVVCASRGAVASASNNETNLKIFPNPSKGIVNLNLINTTSETYITVSNLMGKQISKKAASIGNNTIDLSNLSKGIYLISLISKDGTKTEKIIIE